MKKIGTCVFMAAVVLGKTSEKTLEPEKSTLTINWKNNKGDKKSFKINDIEKGLDLEKLKASNLIQGKTIHVDRGCVSRKGRFGSASCSRSRSGERACSKHSYASNHSCGVKRNCCGVSAGSQVCRGRFNESHSGVKACRNRSGTGSCFGKRGGRRMRVNRLTKRRQVFGSRSHSGRGSDCSVGGRGYCFKGRPGYRQIAYGKSGSCSVERSHSKGFCGTNNRCANVKATAFISGYNHYPEYNDDRVCDDDREPEVRY